jgi:hypothetical protein
MGAASALGRDASILSPLSQALERTRLERADRTGAHFCFALAERSSEGAGPARLVVVQPSRVRSHQRRDRVAPEAITAAGVETKAIC